MCGSGLISRKLCREPFCVYAQEIYERLEELDPSTFETTAAKLLHGLGCAASLTVIPLLITQ